MKTLLTVGSDDEGENDRGLMATDTKTRSLNQAPPVRSSSGYTVALHSSRRIDHIACDRR
jgi:hypothetical protein